MKVYAHDVVQVVAYRRAATIEFLVLKRTATDGGWWQPVTGHIDDGETALEALHREVVEETGIRNLLAVSDQIYSYEYDTKDGLGRDVVYMVEFSRDDTVKLTPAEHEAYAWLGLGDALKQLKYEGNKESLRRAHAMITG